MRYTDHYQRRRFWLLMKLSLWLNQQRSKSIAQNRLALGDCGDLVKLLNSLLDTDFSFELIDVDIYTHLLTMGYTSLVQKIVLRFSLSNIMPNKKLVKELLKSHLNKGNTKYQFSYKNSVYDIALAFKRWPMEDIWLYCISEMLTFNKFQDCENILLLNKLSVILGRNSRMG